MKFGASQKLMFQTEQGTYSVVTEREDYDSQITVTGAEADLLINHFGLDNIHTGSVKSNPRKSRKSFKIYPAGETIGLNLVFPKPEKSELRLYISSKAGFKPQSNSIWFLFIRAQQLWIGEMPESNWRAESSILLDDEIDSQYQSLVYGSTEIKKYSQTGREIFLRDRKVAIKRFELSGYSCEFDSSHSLFTSRRTGKPYLEAHHLVPMALQNEFETSLDHIENIFCLCASCHRAIHHAEKAYTKIIIDRLINKRPETLRMIQNYKIDIHNIYAVEDIIR